ncbi:MAG: 50S ribosomal protein L6 [Nanoarchaeota archaeon]
MRKELKESITIPQGIECKVEGKILTCKKEGVEISRKLTLPGILISLESNNITIHTPKGNKNDYKKIKSTIAHIQNMFFGINNKFTYSLEACNVHFPMTLKTEPGKLIINNFLGEKVPRTAKILPQVIMEVKGTKITLTSQDKEAAGQTAANIEKATKIRYRDRRIFQDGIFITSKPEEGVA